MKVLLAHTFHRLWGGEDRYVRQQAELLSRHHQVHLLAERNEEATDAALRAAAWMAYSRSKKMKIVETIRHFRPDIVHLHNPYPLLGPAVHLASHELRVPLVVTMHNHRLRCPNGYMFTEGAICRRCEEGVYVHALLHDCFPQFRQALAYSSLLWIHRFMLRLQDKVGMFIAPSQFIRQRLVDWGVPEHRAVTVPHLVESLPHVPEVGLYGVYVGRLSPEKGINVLLEALARVGDPPFRVVGDGPIRQDLMDAASRLGLRNTRFLGLLKRREVERVLIESRYAVVPSIWEEPFGLAALEAMAHGRPAIVSSVGGLPELVRDGGGLTFAPGDPDELADRIKGLVSDDDLCHAVGARGLETCRQRYSPEAHLAGLEKSYESCILSSNKGERE